MFTTPTIDVEAQVFSDQGLKIECVLNQTYKAIVYDCVVPWLTLIKLGRNRLLKMIARRTQMKRGTTWFILAIENPPYPKINLLYLSAHFPLCRQKGDKTTDFDF